MAAPIRIRARQADDRVEVALLMPHPMETGMRADGSGGAEPAHYITDVAVSSAGRVVLRARLSTGISKDPLFKFRFRGGVAGDRLTVEWTDNLGETRTDTTTIA